MNFLNLERTFKQAREKGWDTLYVLCDVHGVIIPSGTHKQNEFRFINPDAIEVLQWFSKRKDFRIILWSSSYADEMAALIDWLAKHDIEIDFVNSNPECKDTDRACFTYKPYYNFLIDDRSGFEPEVDWRKIKEELKRLGEWDRESL